MPGYPKVARAYLWSFLFWLGFAPMQATQHHMRFVRQGLQPEFSQVLLVDLVRCFTFALLTPLIFYLGHRYPITRQRGGRRITAYVLGVLPFMVAYSCIHWVLLPPWDPLTQHFEARTFDSLIEIASRFATQGWTYLALTVAAQAYEYFEQSHKQEVERLELQQALAASELQALKSQLHPHFLFNTLHGIATLIESDSRRAKAMVLKLSTLLRTTLDYQTVELISLEKEIKFAESYLELEKMRLGHRLEIRWDLSPEVNHLLVPELILQPLIENAILHGVAPCREGGWVEISTRLSEQFLQLRVRNTVGGKRQGGSGMGLQNTRSRLRYLYSGESRFSFELGPDKDLAIATVVLPALGTQTASAEVLVTDASNV